MSNTLIVIVAARISEWSEKGETPSGYLNPANGFSKIVLVSLVPDNAGFADVQRLCGTASVEIHSINLISWQGLARTFFTPFLIKKYIKSTLKIRFGDEESVSVRAYGDTFAGMVAAIVGQLYSCISVASIHTNYISSRKYEVPSLKHRVLTLLEQRARRYTHEFIDYLAPVYSPALETIPKKFTYKVHLIPNAVSVCCNDIKNSYAKEGKLNLISVGRMIDGKSVFPLLEGLKSTDNHRLTIVGDGPNRKKVEKWILQNDMSDRVECFARVDNQDLVRDLKNYDAFVAYTAYSEIPKTVIEAALVGLPIILNTPDSTLPVEYKDAPIVWVDGSPKSYAEAFAMVHADEKFLECTGKSSRLHFNKFFAPSSCSEKMYRLLTSNRQPKQSSQGSPFQSAS